MNCLIIYIVFIPLISYFVVFFYTKQFVCIEIVWMYNLYQTTVYLTFYLSEIGNEFETLLFETLELQTS